MKYFYLCRSVVTAYFEGARGVRYIMCNENDLEIAPLKYESIAFGFRNPREGSTSHAQRAKPSGALPGKSNKCYETCLNHSFLVWKRNIF